MLTLETANQDTQFWHKEYLVQIQMLQTMFCRRLRRGLRLLRPRPVTWRKSPWGGGATERLRSGRARCVASTPGDTVTTEDRSVLRVEHSSGGQSRAATTCPTAVSSPETVSSPWEPGRTVSIAATRDAWTWAWRPPGCSVRRSGRRSLKEEKLPRNGDGNLKMKVMRMKKVVTSRRHVWIFTWYLMKKHWRSINWLKSVDIMRTVKLMTWRRPWYVISSGTETDILIDNPIEHVIFQNDCLQSHSTQGGSVAIANCFITKISEISKEIKRVSRFTKRSQRRGKIQMVNTVW